MRTRRLAAAALAALAGACGSTAAAEAAGAVPAPANAAPRAPTIPGVSPRPAPRVPAAGPTDGLLAGLRTLPRTLSAVHTDANGLGQVAQDSTPPPGRRLSALGALGVAARVADVRRARAHRAGTYGIAFEKGYDRWQVSFFTRGGRREIAQVLLSDSTGRVEEVWTGFQVAWTMARGYPGAFGRKSNSLVLWLVLSVAFVVPFLNPRRPLSLRHLDLLALSLFSVSLAFFNHADLGASVPLVYPPLLYLLARMLMIMRPGRSEPPVRPLVPVTWLAVAAIFLMGFRIGLNVIDSNVIDVGYAGVIGADRILHGRPIYGAFPVDNQHGDTYGPFTYEAYVPAVAVAGWGGHWDDLPAAHLASVIFDLLCFSLLFWLGRRVRGPTLGVSLAYAWAAWPFTLFALSSDTNDALVGALALGALLAASRPARRGVLAALAALTKVAPLALVPLLALHGRREAPGRRPTLRFGLGFAGAALLAFVPVIAFGGLDQVYDRTIAYQAGRDAPFSVWGLWGGLGAEQVAVQALAVVGALAAAVLPRRPDVVGLAAAAAAVLIGVQLGLTYWFYLYLVWFFPLALVALFAGGEQQLGDRGRVARAVGLDEHPVEPRVLV